jgi:trimethylamine--corrinoid protein Co-methyltransferase
MLQLLALNDSEVETIHQATLRILAETGVVMTHPLGLEVLCGEGAQVRGDRLLIPADLVERMLRRCPARVTVRGRGGASKVLGDGSLHWHNLVVCQS